MIRLAIVDDEESYIRLITGYLERYQVEKGISMEISTYRDGDDILSQFNGQFDIILMDIQMRFVNGMSAAEQIRSADQEVVIMFITNMAQYAIQGYQVDALDYIVKPVEYFSFSRKLDRAVSRARVRDRHFLTLRSEGGMRKLDTSEILYVESSGHDLIYQTAKNSYSARGTIREMEEILSPYGFYRCNKGCLVNMARVDAVADNCCELGSWKIPISRSRKRSFMDALAGYLSGTLT